MPGMVAVTELVDRLDMIRLLDARCTARSPRGTSRAPNSVKFALRIMLLQSAQNPHRSFAIAASTGIAAI